MILNSGIKPTPQQLSQISESNHLEFQIDSESLVTIFEAPTFDYSKFEWKSPKFVVANQKLFLYLEDTESGKVRTLYASTKGNFDRECLIFNDKDEDKLLNYINGAEPVVEAANDPLVINPEQIKITEAQYEQSKNIMNIQSEQTFDVYNSTIKQYPAINSLVFVIENEQYKLKPCHPTLEELKQSNEPMFIFTRINELDVFIKVVSDSCKVRERMMFSLMKKDLVDRVQGILGLEFKQVEIINSMKSPNFKIWWLVKTSPKWWKKRNNSENQEGRRPRNKMWVAVIV